MKHLQGNRTPMDDEERRAKLWWWGIGGVATAAMAVLFWMPEITGWLFRVLSPPR